MASLLDDAYSTADVLSRLRRRQPETMPVETLGGRERRSVMAPEYDDPIESTKALGLGVVSPAAMLAGLYSPEVRQYMAHMQENYPAAYTVGNIGTPYSAIANLLSRVPNGLALLGGLGLGMTANSKSEKDAR